jgi:hypothetical protein
MPSFDRDVHPVTAQTTDGTWAETSRPSVVISMELVDACQAPRGGAVCVLVFERAMTVLAPATAVNRPSGAAMPSPFEGRAGVSPPLTPRPGWLDHPCWTVVDRTE